eukprot:1181008-Prorocentrum_minimum.AAC.1
MLPPHIRLAKAAGVRTCVLARERNSLHKKVILRPSKKSEKRHLTLLGGASGVDRGRASPPTPTRMRRATCACAPSDASCEGAADV